MKEYKSSKKLKKLLINIRCAIIFNKEKRHELRNRLLHSLPPTAARFQLASTKFNEKNGTYNYRIENFKGEPSGINSIGFFYDNIGLSHAGRYVTRTLRRQNIPFITKNFQRVDCKKTSSEFDSTMQNELKYAVNLFNFNSSNVIDYYKIFPEDLKDRFNIIYGYWEYDKFPKHMLISANYANEIWCPSNFILEILSKYYSIPCVKMPVAIEFNQNNLNPYNREYFGLPSSCFLYIFTFDVGSEIRSGRKNPLAVIKAFQKAFPIRSSNVGLVMKITQRPEFIGTPKHDNLIDEIKTLSKQMNLFTISDTLDDNQMKGLINCCDVYVSLHRCEGLGLGMMEAMKLGKPVIATNYSGNTEFMRNDNSCPVDYNLIPSGIEDYLWADPDINQAAYYMQKLFTNKGYYRAISDKARKHIETWHNAKYCADAMKQRLKLLGLF